MYSSDWFELLEFELGGFVESMKRIDFVVRLNMSIDLTMVLFSDMEDEPKLALRISFGSLKDFCMGDVGLDDLFNECPVNDLVGDNGAIGL